MKCSFTIAGPKHEVIDFKFPRILGGSMGSTTASTLVFGGADMRCDHEKTGTPHELLVAITYHSFNDRTF